MSGWSADGNTNPRWQGCEHIAGPSGRCTGCNAKPAGAYVPPKGRGYYASSVGNMTAPKPIGMLGPTGVSSTAWNKQKGKP